MKTLIDVVGRILGRFSFEFEGQHHDASFDGSVKLLFAAGIVLGYIRTPGDETTWFAMPARNMAQARDIGERQHASILGNWIRSSDCSDLLAERERQFSCARPDKEMIAKIQRTLDERAGLLPLQHAA